MAPLEVAEGIRSAHGGSACADYALEQQPAIRDLDGLQVGGASLKHGIEDIAPAFGKAGAA